MPAHLFEPITLRNLTVRNRAWIPPMCQYSAEAQDGVATDWHLAHLGSFARGGAGAVIVEATGVTPEGRIAPQDLGLWNDEQEQALTRIVGFMHSQGAAAGIQLAHAGRKGSTWRPWGEGHTGNVTAEDGGWTTVAPSPIPFPGLAEPEALEETGIDRLVAAFADSAERAIRAGFDLLEIHAAHGYLIHEFLSPLSNTREDGYGGALENRARLLLEVADAVRARVGEGAPLLVRVSATDWTEGGLTLQETIQVVRWLQERGIDMIDVSSGGNAPAAIPVAPGYQVPFAASIRQETGVPTAAVGLITEPVQAEHILATGQADVVLTGREALRDPHFPYARPVSSERGSPTCPASTNAPTGRAGSRQSSVRGGARSGSAAEPFEEAPQLRGALLGTDPRVHLHPMVQTRFAENVEHRTGGPGLLVPGAEDHHGDPRLVDRPGAHRAGLQIHRQSAALQPPGAQPLCRTAQGGDLRMTGRVGLALSGVETLADHLAGGSDDDGAHRHVPGGRGRLRQLQAAPDQRLLIRALAR